MGWMDKIWALKLSPDSVIHASANTYCQLAGLAPERRFVYTDRKSPLALKDTKFTDAAKANVWQEIGQDSLKGIDSNDKLIILAHGSPDKVGSFDAHLLADHLEMWGLKEVGLITFKCCDAGRGDFLAHLKEECNKKNIKVGWLKAYRGRVFSGGFKDGKVVEKVHDVHKGLIGTLFTGRGREKVGTRRYKIVQGNANCPQPESTLSEVDDEVV